MMWGREKCLRRSSRCKGQTFLCLQETKLKEVSNGMIRNLGVGRFLDWATIKAEGASGGILIFWDTRVIQLLEKEEGQYTLSCRFKLLEEDFIWVFTGVYGPTAYGRREDLQEELGAIRGYGEILGV